tara:strand:- start:1056 stop:1451 length:396 start_codon:yes stop_codon:yes gene_type:complete
MLTQENLVKSAHETTTKEEQLLNAPYGQQGAVIISQENQGDGMVVRGDFYCIMAVRDDVVLKAALTDVNWQIAAHGNNGTITPWVGGSATYDIPLPVGMPFYGTFKSIELKDQSAIQGHCEECPKVIAYYR